MSPVAKDGDWKPCEKGALTSTVKRIRGNRRQAVLLRIGSGAVVGLALFLLASFYLSSSPREMACQEVVPMLLSYAQGTLDEDSRKEIDDHLAYCPACQRKLLEIRQREPKLTAWSMSNLVASAQYCELGTRLNNLTAMPFSINR